MNILITGATGFIGKNFIKQYQQQGNHFYALTRSPNQHVSTNKITYLSYAELQNLNAPIDIIINLAGDSIFGYWTSKKKEKILISRIETTKLLLHYVKTLKTTPKLWINASAIGFYGTSDEKQFTEMTTRSGNDFLASVVKAWEETAKQAETLGIRTVFARFGIILGSEGSLKIMRLPVKLFAGGKIGSGEQWMSWIHIDDVTGLLQFIIENKAVKGPINFTAPGPVMNKEFMRALANALKRPYWLPTPQFFMRVMLGEMSELVTKGQFVIPQKAIEQGYLFQFPRIEEALNDILTR